MQDLPKIADMTIAVLAGLVMTGAGITTACARRRTGSWPRGRTGRPEVVRPGRHALGSSELPKRKSADMQWSLVTGIIEVAVGHGRRAGACHAAAGERLDIAEYDLLRLREDLGSVIAVLVRRANIAAADRVPAPADTSVALAA